MRIPLDRESSVPLFEQVASFFRERCRSGLLAPGMKLPSARSLAEELGISRMTTEGAYSQLESEAVVERRQGSGTFVASRVASSVSGRGEFALPAWQRAVARPEENRSALDLAGLGLGVGRSDLTIDLASGLADPALFPASEFRKALRSALPEAGNEALGYGDPRGFAPFRESVARVLSSRGIDARPEEVLVTSGSQEGILLCALLAGERAGPVAVESPTYAAALGLFRAAGLGVVGVPADEGGMRPDALVRVLRDERPSLIYTMPNFQNPSGASLAADRRKAIVELAEKHALPILEDDYVGDLRYEGRDLPALVSIAAPGAVIYTGTFSKMLAPGLRVGYLVARGPVYDRLLELKYFASMAAPNLMQRALHSIFSVGSYENHIRRSRRIYRARRDAFLRAIALHLPEFRLAKPAGGLLAWLRLPEGLGARRLSPACRAAGVLVYPGTQCFPDPSDGESDSFIRLNFATESEERLEEAVRRIAAAAATLDRDRRADVVSSP